MSNIEFTYQNPDILISTEWIYNNELFKQHFKQLYNPNIVNIIWCGEAIHPDFI